MYGKCECSHAAFCMTCSLLMLVEDARGDHMEEAYSRAVLITALWVAMSVSFCLPHPVAVSAFMICGRLCVCTELVWMCVLYVSFGSKVRPMGRAVLCILGPDCWYILQGECKLFCLDLVCDCFVLTRQKLYVGMVVYISWLHSCLCVWM